MGLLGRTELPKAVLWPSPCYSSFRLAHAHISACGSGRRAHSRTAGFGDFRSRHNETRDIETVIEPCGHLSLFMGARSVRGGWQRVIDWLGYGSLKTAMSTNLGASNLAQGKLVMTIERLIEPRRQLRAKLMLSLVICGEGNEADRRAYETAAAGVGKSP